MASPHRRLRPSSAFRHTRKRSNTLDRPSRRHSFLLIATLLLVHHDTVCRGASAIFGGSSKRDQPPPPPPPRENNHDDFHAELDRNRTAPEGSILHRQPPHYYTSSSSSSTSPPPPNNGQVHLYPQYQQQVLGGEPAWNLNQPVVHGIQSPSQPGRSLTTSWGPHPVNNNNRIPRSSTAQSPPPPRRPDPAFFRVDALQRDLDDAMHRERDLLAELRNRSSTVADLEQRERLHIHQIDVLTERVLTVEMTAARNRNEYLELQTNCTTLAALLADKELELEEWKGKCNELLELKAKNEKGIQEWKLKWKSAAKEAEDLAIRIEEHHLYGGEGQYTTGKRKKKKRGFWAWLFFGNAKGEDVNQDRYLDSNNEEDDYDALRERARTNLLTALRTERTVVGELESVVAALQQNNTAIAEQVKSRDRIIQELNDRVAVFEEDKVVLKAALKQLQKEMSDETPKLEDALKEIDRLTKQLKKLQSEHKKEIASLKDMVQQKQGKLVDAQTNLSSIGTYVEKLEERLADFTVMKREIDKREAESKLADARIQMAENAKQELLHRVAELEEDQKELTNILKELADERSLLQNSTRILMEERNEINGTLEKVRQGFANLDDEAQKLRNANDQWAVRSEELERQLNATLIENSMLHEKIDYAETRISELQSQMDHLVTLRENDDRALADATALRNSLLQRISELEGSLQEYTNNHKQTVDTLQQQLEKEIQQNAAGNEERVKLLGQLEQMTRVVEKDVASRHAVLLQEEIQRSVKGKVGEVIADHIDGSRAEPSPTLATRNKEQPRLETQPPVASIPQQVSQNLPPRSASAPKRAFGQGIRNRPNEDLIIQDAPLTKMNSTMENDDELVNASVNHIGSSFNSTLTRKVPILRGFRKFLSKRTGLHGVLTTPSAGTKRKRESSLSSSSLSSPITATSDTATNSTSSLTDQPHNRPASAAANQPLPVSGPSKRS